MREFLGQIKSFIEEFAGICCLVKPNEYIDAILEGLLLDHATIITEVKALHAHESHTQITFVKSFFLLFLTILKFMNNCLIQEFKNVPRTTFVLLPQIVSFVGTMDAVMVVDLYISDAKSVSHIVILQTSIFVVQMFPTNQMSLLFFVICYKSTTAISQIQSQPSSRSNSWINLINKTHNQSHQGVPFSMVAKTSAQEPSTRILDFGASFHVTGDS